MQLSRGESLRDTALVLSRHVDAVGIRTGPERLVEELAEHAIDPGLQHADRRAPPLPGARRPADAARGVRRRSTASARLRRRRQQRRPLARDPRRDRRRRGRRRLARGLSSSSRAPARRSTARSRARRSRGAHAVYTDVWVSMGDERDGRARRAALARLPPRRRAARPRRARRDRAARPAGARRRGDHRRGPLRRRASGSGTRPRTAATPRRRCSSWLLAAEQRRAPPPRATLRLSGATAPAELVLADRLTVESLAFGGAGVARTDGGYVVFVAGRVPRRLVRARRRTSASAPTPRRAPSRCSSRAPTASPPVADHPGAPWQVLRYERQLEVKQAQVDDALRRIGQLDGFALEPIVAGARAVALPQQARVLVRRRTPTARSSAASTRPAPGRGSSSTRGLPAGLRARQRGARGGARAGAASRASRRTTAARARASCATSSSARAGAPASSRSGS